MTLCNNPQLPNPKMLFKMVAIGLIPVVILGGLWSYLWVHFGVVTHDWEMTLLQMLVFFIGGFVVAGVGVWIGYRLACAIYGNHIR